MNYIGPVIKESKGRMESSAFIRNKQETAVFEQRTLCSAGDMKDQSFLHSAAETGKSVRTGTKTLESVLSLEHTFLDVMRARLYGK